ncbi:MAG: hypothetical protein NWE96_04325 [Candidatus Bathyarchaeota archaeon]|nr:hypothetical protein [Candidatus Bathyarchaeota archaeon]
MVDFCDKNKLLIKQLQKYLETADHDFLEICGKLLLEGRAIPDIRGTVWEILQDLDAMGLITIEIKVEPDLDNLRKIKKGDIIVHPKKLNLDLDGLFS